MRFFFEVGLVFLCSGCCCRVLVFFIKGLVVVVVMGMFCFLGVRVRGMEREGGLIFLLLFLIVIIVYYKNIIYRVVF